MNNLLFPLRRVFVALPLEDEAKRRFKSLQENIKEFDDILTLQNPHTPHLTLMYWQEMMEIEYMQLLSDAERIASRAQPFTLQTDGIETFENHGRYAVLYLAVHFSDELAKLKKLCPWPNEKPFVPHITLARIRHSQKFVSHKKKIMKRLADEHFSMDVDRVRLYAEISGVQQTPLTDFPFHQ